MDYFFYIFSWCVADMSLIYCFFFLFSWMLSFILEKNIYPKCLFSDHLTICSALCILTWVLSCSITWHQAGVNLVMLVSTTIAGRKMLCHPLWSLTFLAFLFDWYHQFFISEVCLCSLSNVFIQICWYFDCYCIWNRERESAHTTCALVPASMDQIAGIIILILLL